MQPPTPPRRNNSTGIIITILLVVGFLFLCGLTLAAVGAFVFARANTGRAHAIGAREMARSQAERLRADMEVQRNHAQAQQQLEHAIHRPGKVVESRPAKRVKEPIRVANREITLQLDKQGKIKMDGKPVEQKQLATLLRNAGKGRESALTVTIKADKKCLFEYVANVLSVCQELDIPNVRITAAQ